MIIASFLVLAQTVTAPVSSGEAQALAIGSTDGAPKPAAVEGPPDEAFEFAATDGGVSPAMFVCRSPRAAEVAVPQAEATFAVTQLAARESDGAVAFPSRPAPDVDVAK